MNKPEKREIIWDCNCRGLGCKHCHSQGYNQACDDWEEWLKSMELHDIIKVSTLPSEEEIRKFIIKFIAGKDCPYTHFRSRIVGVDELEDLAKAIYKRIRGE